jgi:hypothetical protein
MQPQRGDRQPVQRPGSRVSRGGRMSAPFLVAKNQDLGREVWAKFDDGAEVYELFNSKECDDYIDCVEFKSQCAAAARSYFQDLRCY